MCVWQPFVHTLTPQLSDNLITPLDSWGQQTSHTQPRTLLCWGRKSHCLVLLYFIFAESEGRETPSHDKFNSAARLFCFLLALAARRRCKTSCRDSRGVFPHNAVSCCFASVCVSQLLLYFMADEAEPACCCRLISYALHAG